LSKEDKKAVEELRECEFVQPKDVDKKSGFFRKVREFFD
jgi:hypothetical protein